MWHNPEGKQMIAFLYATLISSKNYSVQINFLVLQESCYLMCSLCTELVFFPNYSYVTSKLFYILCPLIWPFIGIFSVYPGWHFFDIQNNFLIFATKWMMTLSKRKLCQSLHYTLHTHNDAIFMRHFHFFFYSRDHFVVLIARSLTCSFFSHFRTLTASLCLKIMLFMNKMRCNRGNWIV